MNPTQLQQNNWQRTQSATLILAHAPSSGKPSQEVINEAQTLQPADPLPALFAPEKEYSYLQKQELAQLLAIEPSFAQASKEEKSFLLSMTLQNIGNLFGRSFIKNKCDRFKGKLEGYLHRTEPLLFLVQGMELLINRLPGFGTEQQKLALKSLRSSLPLFKFFDECHIAAKQSTKKEDKVRLFQLWLAEVRQQLKTLTIGKQLLLPWGWENSHKTEVPLLLLFTKSGKGLDLQVINSGKGLDMHPSCYKGKKRVYEAVKDYAIPDSRNTEWEACVDLLFEPLFFYESTFGNSMVSYTVEELYNMLEPFASTAKKPSPQIIKQNRCCAMRTLGIAFGLLGGSWSAFKFALSTQILNLACSYNGTFRQLDPLYGPFLDRMLRNHFRHLEKPAKFGIEHGNSQAAQTSQQQFIEQFEQWEEKLKEWQLAPSPASFSLPETMNTWLNEKILKVISPKKDKAVAKNENRAELSDDSEEELDTKPSKKKEASRPKPLPHLSPDTIDLEKLLEAITQLHWLYRVSIESSNQILMEESSKVDTLRFCIKLFLDPQWEVPREKILAELKACKEKRCQLLLRIAGLAQHVEWPPHLPATHLVLEGARLVVWMLTRLEEEIDGIAPEDRLTRYALSTQDLAGFENPPQNLLSLASWYPFEEEIRVLKTNYQLLFPEGAKELFPRKSFTVINSDMQASCVLDETAREYIARFASRLPQKDKQEVQERLKERMNERKITANVDEEEWLQYWLFTEEKLPPSFYALWRLSIALYTVSVERNRYEMASRFDGNNRFHLPLHGYKSIREDVPGKLSFPIALKIDTESDKWPDKLTQLVDGTKATISSCGDKDKLPLWSSTQNQQLVKKDPIWHEAVSILSAKDPAMQLAMLLDCYSSNPLLLSNIEHRLLIGMVLTTPLLVPKAIRKAPHLAKELFNFFKMRLSRKQEELVAATQEHQEAAIGFLLRQWGFCAVAYGQVNKVRSVHELKKVKKELRKRLEEPQKSKANQWQLQLSYLLCLPIVDKPSQDVLLELLGLFHSLHQTLTSFKDRDIWQLEPPPYLLYEAAARWQPQFQAAYENFFNLELVARLWPHQKLTGVEKNGFPWLRIITGEGAYDVNIFTGEVPFNGITLQIGGTIPSFFIFSTAYERLFDERDPPKIVGFETCLKDSSQHVLVQDNKTSSVFTLAFKSGNKRVSAIYRMVEGSPYHLIASRFPYFTNSFCWQSDDRKSNLLFERTNDRLIGSVDSEGWFHPVDAPGIKKRFATNLPWELPFFQKYQPDLIESVDEKGASGMVLSFDSVYTPDGHNLAFTQEKTRWVYSADRTYAIAQQQKSAELDLSGYWLLLEKNEREQVLLVSLCSYGQEKSEKMIALELDAKGALIRQKSTQANLLIAYYLMQEARYPQDYAKAASFLSCAQPFRRYNEGEAALLAKISSYVEDKAKDKDEPEMHALRLQAAFLLKENFSQHPLVKPKKADKKHASLPGRLNASDEDWSLWARRLQKELFNDKHAEISSRPDKSVIRKARHAYLLNRNNLNRSLLLEKRFSREQLKEYDLYRAFFNQVREGFSLVPNYIRQKISHASTITQLVVPVDLINNSTELSIQAPKTRPNKPFGHYSRILLTAALSGEAADRSGLLQRFNTTKWPEDNFWYEHEQKDLDFFVYLLANAVKDNPVMPGRNSAKQVARLFNARVVHLIETSNEECEFLPDRDICSNFIEEYKKESDPQHKRIEKEHPLAASAHALRPMKSRDLLVYRPDRELYKSFQELGEQLFKEHVLLDQVRNNFFVQKGIDCSWLNEEFSIGARHNAQQSQPSCRLSIAEVKTILLGSGRQCIVDSQTRDKEQEQLLCAQIVATANQGLTGHLQERIDKGGGRSTFMDIQEVLLLCCHADRSKIAKKLYMTEVEVDALGQVVGRFCEASLRRRHAEKLLALIDELKNTSDDYDLHQLLSSLHKQLAEPYRLVELGRLTPLVLLSYQHLMGINFRSDQVEGLFTMLSSSNGHILQMATGGGKTSVLAQLGAFAAADGDHLSVLVTPVHQFNAILPSIGRRAEDFLQQHQYAFIFEDKPPFNKLKHLYNLYQLACKAQKEKAFLHTTPLALRALRTAYIQTKLDLYNPDLKWSHTQEKELTAKTIILENILKLFRSKGCFIFDEVDEATNPYKIYNKGVGKKMPLDAAHLQLIQDLIEQVISAKGRDGSPLVPLKQLFCTRIDWEASEALTNTLATYIVQSPFWLERLDCLQLLPAERKELAVYLSEINALPPKSVQSRLLQWKGKGQVPVNQGLELLALLRDLLAGKAILGSLSQSFYEDYLLEPHAPLPIAVPTKSHMQAAEHSEFSNPYRMVLNTFWGYYVAGISLAQTEELLMFLRKHAVQELSSETNVSAMKLQDTPTAMAFARMAKAYDLNPDLFSSQIGDAAVQARIRAAINEGSPVALPLLLTFVTEHILMQKKLYTKEVACTGIATMLMTKKSSGFTATLDQQLIAPYLSKERGRVSIGFSDGVFGKRIDLMLRRHHELYIIGDEPKSLFSDLLMQLEPAKQSKVRAIIDGGCHFRGIDNHAVARLICEELGKMSALKMLKGVLFFDIQSNRPLYMHINSPYSIEEIHSLHTEERDGSVFYSSFGAAVDETFVLFSSDKATGTDVPLPENAIILSTMPSKSSAGKSPFFLKIQADGRARGLDKKQQVITTVPKSLVLAMAKSFEDPNLHALSTGPVTEGKELLQKLFIYVWGQHVSKKCEESRLLALHQMMALIQQTLLDAVYEKPELQELLFSKYRTYFEEDVSINFIEMIGMPRKEISLEMYWEKVIQALILPLGDFMPRHEVDTIEDILKKIGEEAADLHAASTISLPQYQAEPEKAFLPATASSADGQMVQAQSQSSEQQSEQEQSSVKNKIATRERDRYSSFSTKPAEEGGISLERLFAKNFASRKENFSTLASIKEKPKTEKLDSFYRLFKFSSDDEIDVGSAPQGLCHSLNTILSRRSWWKSSLFSSRLMVSDGYLETVKGDTNLLDSYQKPPQVMLLIRDDRQDSTYTFRMVLLSVHQAEAAAAHLTAAAELYQKQGVLPSTERKMWLITTHGLLAAPSPYAYNSKKIFESGSLRSLFVQLYFFMGDWRKLEEPLWHDSFKKWAVTKDRQQLRTLFEQVLQVQEGYFQSKTFALLSDDRS
jgi:hypothetical protein